jgi:hypothetical protein
MSTNRPKAPKRTKGCKIRPAGQGKGVRKQKRKGKKRCR